MRRATAYAESRGGAVGGGEVAEGGKTMADLHADCVTMYGDTTAGHICSAVRYVLKNVPPDEASKVDAAPRDDTDAAKVTFTNYSHVDARRLSEIFPAFSGGKTIKEVRVDFSYATGLYDITMRVVKSETGSKYQPSYVHTVGIPARQTIDGMRVSGADAETARDLFECVLNMAPRMPRMMGSYREDCDPSCFRIAVTPVYNIDMAFIDYLLADRYKGTVIGADLVVHTSDAGRPQPRLIFTICRADSTDAVFAAPRAPPLPGHKRHHLATTATASDDYDSSSEYVEYTPPLKRTRFSSPPPRPRGRPPVAPRPRG